MSDIRFNRWLHQSGTGGVYQDSSGNIGIGTSTPTSALDIQSGNIKIGSNTLSSSGVSTFTTVNATTLTGNLTGNVTGNVTGNLTGDVTASTITVGDKFINSSGVGIGSTTTAGRNAGVGTAVGTLIYNTSTNEVQIYKTNAGWVNVSNVGDGIEPLGMTATGGVVSDYTHPDGNVYRAHIFTASGTFDVTALSSSLPNSIEYLVVAGGGGGGSHAGGGGGGAGGLRTNVPGVVDAAANPLTASAFPVSVTSYTVTIGAGGVGEPFPGNSNVGSNGGNSTFGPITSTGGGLGAGGNPGVAANSGGSGGGGGGFSPSAASGNTPPTSPPQGRNGGAGNGPNIVGGGGGGAGSVGGDWSPSPYRGGHGGAGVQVLISGPPTSNQLIGAPGPSGTGWFAGGGGGGTHQPGGTGGTGGGSGGPYAGGANGLGTSSNVNAPSGTRGTGGGGGGAGGTNGSASSGGGNGGSGIVAVRYQIGQTGTAKATGGAITFNDGKTIHQFTSSGTFTITDSSLNSADILVVGGGGGGASRHGGGGGAGALIYRTGETVNPSPGVYTITVGSGGNGLYGAPLGSAVKGTDTTAFGFTAEGGGYGISSPGAGGGGGSGGGTRGNANPPSSGGTASGAPGGTNGATSPPVGWGNPGGLGDLTPGNGGGGGGGAGGVGGAGSPTLAGSGGIGLSYNISGITTHYAGGGGGAYQPGWPLDANGSGGLGGGGQGGGDDLSAIQGHRGTGGGGGAGGDAGAPHPLSTTWGPKSGIPGGNGGSGIVIISYPT